MATKTLPQRVRLRHAYAQMERSRSVISELAFSQLMAIPDAAERYGYAHNYFRLRAPEIIREHRRYFTQDFRGYGEQAFHAMWYLLMLERHPRKMLEIGVYRGQTVSLWALIAKHTHCQVEARGVTPLIGLGDEVSTYLEIDYAKDIREHYAHFELGEPTITRALSTDPEGVATIRDGGPWDVVYIDGCHDRAVVEHDFHNSLAGLSHDGLIVMDDAALFHPMPPPPFAFRGHPGPSEVAEQIAAKEMRPLGSVGHNVVFIRKE
jgi:Methyltransferase domain